MARDRGRRGRAPLTSAEPVISDAKVDVVLQRIEEPIGAELKVIPEHVRRYGVNNIFQRTFSYLFGWMSDGRPVKLAATLAGALKIASVGAGLEKTERKTGTGTDTLSAAVVFTQVISRVDVVVDTYKMHLYPSPDNVTFYDPVLCIPGVHNVYDIAMKAFKVLRADINDVEYNVVGEW